MSLYAYVNPIIAMVLGTLLLSEPFSVRILLAAAFVLIGIGIIRTAPPKATMPAAGAKSGA